jgi:PAS domain S-box-containing protein
MKLTVRIWQTALFSLVALAAILPFYFMFLPSYRHNATMIINSRVIRELDFMARVVTIEDGKIASGEHLEVESDRFTEALQVDLWLYDANKKVILSRTSRTEPGNLLNQALAKGLANEKYVYSNIDTGFVLAARPVVTDGKVVGVIILSEEDSRTSAAVATTQKQLNTIFIMALVIATVIGFVFSEAIRRRIQTLRRGAFTIAQGNFNLRLKTGMVPDEMAELVKTFNVMAGRLGEAFATLKDQQGQILRVINAMGEGLIEVGADGLINLVNPEAERLLGKPAENLIGNRLKDLPDHKHLEKVMKEVFKGKESTSVYRHEDRVFLMHGTAIKETGDKEIKGGVLIIRDFTRQYELEQTQRDFITNASHQLRTPVSALKGYTELLMGSAGEDAPTKEKFLKSMETEVTHMERLIENLFMLARLDSQSEIVAIGKHLVAEIAQDVLAITFPLAEAGKVNLEVNLETTPAQEVICDCDRIVEVLAGFVENAIKYTPEGGSVTIFSKPDGDRVRLGAMDSGVGIPPGEIDKIFDRFYRYDTTGKKRKGAGLGLSIAKEIIEAHGSRIEVSSVPGKGSTFWFTLKTAPKKTS